MKRLFAALAVLVVLGCGTRPRPDGGTEEDAGTDAGVDAGRLRGAEPPNGYSLALPIPTGTPTATRFGVGASAAADQFAQPMLAAITVDPNGDGVLQDNALVFTRWNGASQGFEAARTLEVVGEIDLAHPSRQVSLARDADTGRLGIAYLNAAGNVRLATSDDEGANWSLETVTAAASTGHPLSNPCLALAGGKVHLAYSDAAGRASGAGVLYRVRTGSGGFQDTQVPLLVGTESNLAGPLALALDSAGSPGLAYFLKSSTDATVTLAFWRPGAAGATKVADSANTANDAGTARAPSVSLTFAAELPRVAYHLATIHPDGQVWFAAASAADGAAWAAPVAMPRNGVTGALEGTQWYQALAVEGAKVAVVSNYQQSTGAASQCGGPKLSRSSDGASFTTCAPDSVRTFGFAGQYPSLFTHKPGKLTLLFNYETRTNPTIVGGGVVLWREP